MLNEYYHHFYSLRRDWFLKNALPTRRSKQWRYSSLSWQGKASLERSRCTPKETSFKLCSRFLSKLKEEEGKKKRSSETCKKKKLSFPTHSCWDFGTTSRGSTSSGRFSSLYLPNLPFFVFILHPNTWLREIRICCVRWRVSSRHLPGEGKHSRIGDLSYFSLSFPPFQPRCL